MDKPDSDKPRPTPEPPPDDDDAELELEPLDETIEERQKQAALNAIRARIDIDEVYGDAERDHGGEIMENWFRNFRFQFQLRHLLIATAVVAIILTLIKLQLFWTTLIVGVMLSTAGLYLYLRVEEKKHEVEAERRRQALYTRRRAQMAASMGAPLAEQFEANLETAPPPTNKVDERWQQAANEQKLHFQFSLRQMLVLMTAAAVTLTLVRLLGGPSATASVLGLFAIGGLVVYACGYEPPQNMILAWWLILVMYVLISICTAVWSAFA
jgi:hypothetical protein